MGRRAPDQARGRVRRLLRRQRLMLLLFLAVLTGIVAARFRHRIDWYGDAPIRVLVLELLLPGTEMTNALMAFNGTPVREPAEVTVHAAESFFPQEFERYNEGESARVEVRVHGPFPAEVDPPDLYDADASTFELWRRSVSYVSYFEDLASELGVDFDDYDVRMVVIFVPGEQDEQIEAGSLASPSKRFGVVYLNLFHMDHTYSALTLLHEMGHAFGASDKYDYDTFLARWPHGYVAPGQVPVFPQQHAELMAADIPLAEDDEREILDLSEVRIGVQTAHEMGWVGTLDRWLYYRDLPEQPPPSPLSPVEPAPAEPTPPAVP